MIHTHNCYRQQMKMGLFLHKAPVITEQEQQTGTNQSSLALLALQSKASPSAANDVLYPVSPGDKWLHWLIDSITGPSSINVLPLLLKSHLGKRKLLSTTSEKTVKALSE